MRPSLPAALLGLVLGLAIAPLEAATLIAEAPPVGPFSRIEISGHAEVVLVQGERETVTVEGSPKHPSRVRVRSSEGRLVIGVADDDRGWWSGLRIGRPPKITIHFRTLESLSLSGAVKVHAVSIVTPALRIRASGAAALDVDELKTGELRFTGSGAVKSDLAGTATAQDIRISGAGAFRAAQLVSDDVNVRVSGAGRVIVHANKTLVASISGAGAIDYYGDPEVKQNVSGAGKITRRTAEVARAAVRA